MKKFVFSLLGLLVASPVLAEVSTTGVGTVYAKPDCAQVSFTAHSENAVAQTAYKDNGKITEALWTVFTKHKIADSDIKTGSFSIKRNYDKDGKFVNFSAEHTATITIHNLGDVGCLVDDAVGTGCNLDGVIFQIKNREVLEKQARNLAVADAKSKAEQLCKGLGAKLGAVKTIGEASEYYFQDMPYNQLAPGGMSTRIGAGEQAVIIRVGVTWDTECCGK